MKNLKAWEDLEKEIEDQIADASKDQIETWIDELLAEENEIEEEFKEILNGRYTEEDEKKIGEEFDKKNRIFLKLYELVRKKNDKIRMPPPFTKSRAETQTPKKEGETRNIGSAKYACFL